MAAGRQAGDGGRADAPLDAVYKHGRPWRCRGNREGPGIRLDSALFLGMRIEADYDSLIAKVIAWAEDRPAAVCRLLRGLGDYQIGGIPTDIGFLQQVLQSSSYQDGRADTTYLDTFQLTEPLDREDVQREVALAAALLMHRSQEHKLDLRRDDGDNWQTTAWREQM